MTAETAYNVYSALPEDEKKRFFIMCGVRSPKPKKQIMIGGMTLEEITEHQIRTLKLKR